MAVPPAHQVLALGPRIRKQEVVGAEANPGSGHEAIQGAQLGPSENDVVGPSLYRFPKAESMSAAIDANHPSGGMKLGQAVRARPRTTPSIQHQGPCGRLVQNVSQGEPSRLRMTRDRLPGRVPEMAHHGVCEARVRLGLAAPHRPRRRVGVHGLGP